jgi:hypothetical protein
MGKNEERKNKKKLRILKSRLKKLMRMKKRRKKLENLFKKHSKLRHSSRSTRSSIKNNKKNNLSPELAIKNNFKVGGV